MRTLNLSFLFFFLFILNLYPQASEDSIVEVIVPNLSGQVADGEKFYNSYCISCHGINASGRSGIGPPLIHKIYEPSHHGDKSFLYAVSRGVKSHHWTFGDMPSVEGIREEEVLKIIKYIRALQRANDID